jgi:hypothetical protein
MPPSVPLRTSPTREQARETTESQEKKRAPKRQSSTTASRTNKANTTAEEQDTSAIAFNSNNVSSILPGNQLGMYGATSGMYGGMNSVMFGGGGGGMMGSPYYGGMVGGPLSGLNQMLFSVQSVIFSLGQAVQVCHTSVLLRLLHIRALTICLSHQIVGMNTQALHQLLDTATSMFDHALSTFQEMRALDARSLENESPEDQTKRRRLKALRWAFIMSIAYGGYRLMRRLLRRRQYQRQLSIYPAQQQQQQQQQYSSGYTAPAPMPPPLQQQYGGNPYGSYAMSNPYSSYYGAGGASSMYPGGAYGGYF